MTKYSVALVALPGDVDTLDRVFGALTMSMRGELRDFPVVLMGGRYWRPIVDHIDSSMAREAPVEGAGQRLLLVSDSPDEATSFVLHHALHRFGTKLQPGRARRILGERALHDHAERFRHRPRGFRLRGRRPRPSETA
jgi:predicted Rossmann-fold nucleotide-binding protein